MHEVEEEMTRASGKELDLLLESYGKLSEWFESQGGYEIEACVSRISNGLHMSERFLEKPFMT